MKKTFRLILAIAAAAISATACQTEIEQATGNTVNFRAVDVATKTTFGTASGNTLPTLWQEDDQVKLYVNYTVNGSATATVTPSQDGTTATFTASLSSDDKSISIAAVCPSSASTGASTGYKSLTVNIPTSQTPTASSVDPEAQVICAVASGYSSMPSSVDLTFHHVTAYAKMNINNLDCGSETVTAVSITSTKAIAGRWYYYAEGNDDHSAGEVEANSASSTITVNTSSLSNIWFALAPVSVDGESFKISVVTTGGTYSKTINFSGKSFQSGHVASFNVDMNGVTKDADQLFTKVTDASALTVGKEVIIAAAGYNYAISTTQNSSNRGQAAITKSGDVITNPSEAVQIFTIAAGTTTGTIAFSTGDGYIYASGTSANQLKTEETLSANSSWKVTISNTGTASIVAQGSNTRNVLQYNQPSSLFACYASASQKAVAIYARDASATRKTSQALSFSQTAYEIDINDTFTKPVLTGAMTDVTYSSSNTSVATVNATTGDVTILAAGTTTITATAEEDETYYEGEASYTITVTETASSISAISTVASGVLCAVEGKIVAIATGGFIVADATGAIYVNKTPASTATIGQTVTVNGTPTVYGTAIEFPSDAEVTLGATGTYEYPTPTTFDSAAATTFLARDGANLAQYVTFRATVSGTRDFILSGDSAAKVTGWYMPTTFANTVSSSSEVTVTGYATFINSNKVAVVVTDVVQEVAKTGTVFDFTSSTQLTAWGITLPNKSAGTNIANNTSLTLDGKTVKFTKSGSTSNRIWNSNGKYTLRTYLNATFSVSVSSGNLTKVTLSGSTIDFSASTGSISNGVWTPSSSVSSVTFTCDTNSTISTITVE